MGKLISIGEALVDRLTYPNGSIESLAGGAPANVAACVAYLGQASMLLTKLGDDEEGKLIHHKLASMNVDMRYVLVTNAHQTTIADVTIDEKGDRHFRFDRRNASDLFLTPEEIPFSIVEPEDILHFGSVDLVPSLMKDTTTLLLLDAKRKGAMLSFDPNLRFSLWPNEEQLKATVHEYMLGVDVLKVTLEELDFLFPNQPLRAQLDACFQAKIRVVIVSKGSEGVSLYTASGFETHLPSHPIKVIDTTGAGDGLMAGFLFQLLERNATKEQLLHDSSILLTSLKFANAVAALVCTKKGAIPAFPDFNTVQTFINK